MTGILSPNEGDIVINGYSIVKEPLEAKRQFGFVLIHLIYFAFKKGIEYLNFM